MNQRAKSESEDGRMLREEAKCYARIARSPSAIHITPRFYGVFGCSGAIALVMEYGGEKLA